MSAIETTKVLLIDDEPDILEFLKYNFSKAGHAVLTACDGEQALKLIERVIPDIIICDILMPNMDGIDFCRILKMQDDHSNTPVIFLSAYSDEHLLLKAIESGGEVFLSKPIRFPILLKMVRSYLDKIRKMKLTTEH